MESITIYWISIVLFHTSEFALALIYERANCATTSFLLSKPYVLAMALSLLEYHMTKTYVAGWKGRMLESTQAIALCGLFVGEGIRKGAWLTAKASFTHLVQVSKRPDHKLVTTGIYRFCRHPGYVGWFLWALSTQLLLANVMSTLLFAIVIWRFFNLRIEIEEAYLLEFFGNDYATYKKRTPTWIPGIP